MKFFENIKNNFQAFRQDMKENKANGNSDGSLFRITCMWVYKLRSVFLAIPVAFTAILLAIDNLVKLPEVVEICIPAEGFAIQIVELSKMVAVSFFPSVINPKYLV